MTPIPRPAEILRQSDLTPSGVSRIISAFPRYGQEPHATMQAEDIQAMIRAGLPQATHISVSGDGTYFKAVVVSDSFAGQGPVQQHRQVYATLGDKMRAEIHALSMQTLTPEEWEAAGRPEA